MAVGEGQVGVVGGAHLFPSCMLHFELDDFKKNLRWWIYLCLPGRQAHGLFGLSSLPRWRRRKPRARAGCNMGREWAANSWSSCFGMPWPAPAKGKRCCRLGIRVHESSRRQPAQMTSGGTELWATQELGRKYGLWKHTGWSRWMARSRQ
jgi:hypothetical protein